MVRDAKKRLRALERKAPAVNGAGFDQLMALARAGRLDNADLTRLTDEQLWWLVVQEPIALPPDEQLERRLREVAGGGSQG